MAAILESEQYAYNTNNSKTIVVAKNFLNFEECRFMCSEEWKMIRHMIKEHEETINKYCSCDTHGP